MHIPTNSHQSTTRAGATVLAALLTLGTQITAFADQVTLPHTFVDGTTANADEVNANFQVLTDESNAQDVRLGSIEATGGDITAVSTDSSMIGGADAGAVSLGIAPGGVGSSEVLDGSLTAIDIAPGAIGTNQLAPPVNNMLDTLTLAVADLQSRLTAAEAVIAT